MFPAQASVVLDGLRHAGLKFALTSEMGLRVTPPRPLTPAQRESIRCNKAVLVQLLKNEAANVAETWPPSTPCQAPRTPTTTAGSAAFPKEAARTYYGHHFTCPTCISAGQTRGQRCATGAPLWIEYNSL